VASTGVWASDVVVGDVLLRVGGINCVGTLPDYRRHGLGSQVMAAAHQKMRDLGCHVALLSTGIMNWYRRLGWEEAGTMRSYRLNRGNIGLLPSLRAGLRLRFVEVDDEAAATEMVRLHHDRRLGARRSVERFQQLAAARRVDRIALAEGEGGAAAYLLVRDNLVLEWGGEAEEVAGLVRACYEAMDDPQASTSQRASDGGPLLLRTLMLYTPGWQLPLVRLLDVLRIPYNSEYLGMIYLVNPQGILDAYRIPDVRVVDVGEEFVVWDGAVSQRFDRRQLTKLFLGPERMSEIRDGVFPLPFWQWVLEKV
jgi:hypothetical protein